MIFLLLCTNLCLCSPVCITVTCHICDCMCDCYALVLACAKWSDLYFLCFSSRAWRKFGSISKTATVMQIKLDRIRIRALSNIAAVSTYVLRKRRRDQKSGPRLETWEYGDLEECWIEVGFFEEEVVSVVLRYAGWRDAS